MRRKQRKVTTYPFIAHPYGVDVCVIVGETLGHAQDKLRKMTGVDLDFNPTAVATTYCHRNKKGERRIFMIFARSAKTRPDLMAHEAVHAVNFIYHAKGVEWDLENDEPHAYMIDQMVATINHALKTC